MSAAHHLRVAVVAFAKRRGAVYRELIDSRSVRDGAANGDGICVDPMDGHGGMRSTSSRRLSRR